MSIRIADMPNLGSVTDGAQVVGENAGSGLFAVTALRSYVMGSSISVAMAPVVAAPTIAAAVRQLGALGEQTSTAPALSFTFTEALDTGANTYQPIVVDHRRTGGHGHRQAFTSQLSINGAAPDEMNVGAALFAFIETGSGSNIGANAYARATTGAASTAAIVGFEANTDAQVAVKRKIGIQVVDVAASTADGTDYSAAIYIAREVGGLGYRDGILFGDDTTVGMNGARTTYIRAATNAGAVSVGIDFRTATFGGAAIALPTGATSAINWASGNGGALVCDTATNGPSVHFGNHGWSVVGSTGATALSLGTSATPTVSLYVTGVGMRQVTAGAPDSGGAGLRTLAVPN